MEQQIRDRYRDTILQEAMHRYGIAKDEIRSLDAFESFIYAFERRDRGYILRIGHSLRKSEGLIRGEVDWINYLADGGVSAAKTILSETGKLVETVDDGQGGQFLVTAFEKARGQPPWDLWTPTLYETYGQMLGSMHALTEQYQPAEVAWRRPEWDDDLFELVEHFLPASETVVREKYRAVFDHLHTLPKDKTTYGLIHQDAHGNNFFVDDAGRITLFDFDDCAYSWFSNDIAIVLFYIVQDADDPPTFTREFMTHFLRGYQQAYPLDPQWLKEIPAFLKLREIELYAVMHRDFDISNIDDAWCARFMHDRKYKIEHDVPYIEFDFESLSVYG
ncbi:MAG: phosphotransferase enzyme family protein [Anaerolineales bacterium]